MSRLRFCLGVVATLFAAGACSEAPVTEEIPVVLATSDAFANLDAVAGTLTVENALGATLATKTVKVPTTTLTVGDLTAGEVINLALRVTDPADGRLALVGETGLFSVGSSRPMLLQRTGTFAPLTAAPFALGDQAPLVGTSDGNLVAGLADGTLTVLDGRSRRSGPIALRPAAVANAFLATTDALLVIEGSDFARATAEVLDLNARAFYPIDPPTNLRFADVAGGATVRTPSGGSFLIGGTRTTTPSARGIRAASDGTLEPLLLQASRKGAALVQVPGVGLVVVGGAETAPGAELILDATTNGTSSIRPLSTNADSRTGLALATWDSQRVLVAAEDGSLTLLDTVCAPTCPVTPLPSLPPATHRTAVASATNDVLVGGVEAGAFVVHRVRANGTSVVPGPNARADGRLVRAFSSGILVVGGDATPWLFRGE